MYDMIILLYKLTSYFAVILYNNYNLYYVLAMCEFNLN